MIKSLSFDFLEVGAYCGLLQYAKERYETVKGVDYDTIWRKDSSEEYKRGGLAEIKTESFDLLDGLKFHFEETIFDSTDDNLVLRRAKITLGRGYLSECQKLLKFLNEYQINRISFVEFSDNELGSCFSANALPTRNMPLNLFVSVLNQAVGLEKIVDDICVLSRVNQWMAISIIRNRIN